MPEIKHTFAGARMNKDVDERLVPNGEYRNAENVKVRNTDSQGSDGVGDAGTVQNIKGNKAFNGQNQYLETAYASLASLTIYNQTRAVGSISNEKNNKAYFLMAAPTMKAMLHDGALTSLTSKKLLIDSIVEVDTVNSESDPTSKLVVVDKWGVIDTKAGVFSEDPVMPFQTFTAVDASDYRLGMGITAIDSNGNPKFSSTIQNISGNEVTLYHNVSTQNFDDVYAVKFIHPDRPLNFDPDRQISAINTMDDLLFWTDNKNEPKKINIKRCIDGTNQQGKTQTQLKLKDPKDKDVLLDYSGDVDSGALEIALTPINNDLKEEHITVIRRAPKIAPTLEMKTTDREGETSADAISYDIVGQADANGFTLENGYEFSITDTSIAGENAPNWFENDILIFTELISSNEIPTVKTTLNSFDKDTGTINLTVISFSNDPQPANSNTNGSGVWDIEIQQKKPLFELKMVRFGSRYRYEDGEISSFGPWSELAFLPGKYKYTHKKGFNLGMVNNVRSLKVKDFIPYQKAKNADIVAVDILYKPTDSPVCYIVKTIKRGIDPEWDLFTTPSPEIQPPSNWLFGEINITSEMIYRAVDANQLLRAWDNVPRYALAQEMAANRLMFANYVQGYDINSAAGLIVNHNMDETASIDLPKKSIKTIRNYKFGMVFGDKYGRETPVVANGYLKGDSVNNPVMLGGDVQIEKQFAAMRNYFELTQDWNSVDPNGVPEEWMEYVKYYVKETSNEYYNLIMDRWYEAEDGNVWISFNSADRNKIDEETYLILKKTQNSNQAVLEKARYKVIAISNEAPNDIKTEGRDMGGLSIPDTNFDFIFTAGSSANVNTDTPDLLMTEKQLKIDGGTWQNYLKDYKPKGDLKVRITGKDPGFEETLHSRTWRTVTYYSTIGSGSEPDGFIRWNKTFGEEADMRDRFNNIGVTPTGLVYGIEFKEDVITENKAEFDGKFFVKLEKDEVLENKVLLYSDQTAEYDTIRTVNLAYIDNQSVNPGNQWSFTDEDGNTTASTRHDYRFQSSDATASNDSTDNLNGENIAPVIGSSQVVGANGAGGLTVGSGGDDDFSNFLAFGCDSGPGVNQNGFAIADNVNGGAYQLESSGQRALNMARITMRYWRYIKETASADCNYKLFIDGCRARLMILDTASSFGNNIDGDEDSGGEKSPHNYKPTGVDPGYQSGDGYGPTIDGELGRIFISGFWINSQQGTPNPNFGFNLPFNDSFRTEMTQSGTLFRFANDPTGNVYKVVGTPDNVLAAHNFSKLINEANGNTPTAGSQGSSSSLTIETFLLSIANGGYQDGGSYSEPSLSNIIIAGANGTDISTGCLPCETVLNDAEQKACRRDGFRVEFRLFDTTTGQLAGSGNRGIDTQTYDPRSSICHDGREVLRLNIVKQTVTGGDAAPTENAACFETEPKEDVGLDLYYEASNAIPMRLNRHNASYFAPYKSKVTSKDANLVGINLNTNYADHHVSSIGYDDVSTGGGNVIICVKSTTVSTGAVGLHSVLDLLGTGAFEFAIGTFMVFEHRDGTKTMAKVTGYATPLDSSLPLSNDVDYEETVFTITNSSTATPTGYYQIETDVYKNKVELPWFNCYSFGNGVESDRIRDDFNAPQIDNGVKVSTTFLNFGEELKGSTIIYSGIYNSISGTNNLNEFNQAEKITKDLNPSYGSIQALKTRDTDLIALAEDKVLRVITNKDALFNADGNAQLTATDRVLGTAMPFAGDYGISKNPESLAADEYRMYFTDKQRGAVLRLSQDGMTPISSVGMKTYFRDNLGDSTLLLGTYDKVNSEYNLTIRRKSIGTSNDKTISFNEGSKGWTSFKSFIPDAGTSVSGKYFTVKNGTVYVHNDDSVDRNTFYNVYYESSLKMVFNDLPGSIKTFQAANYEGSQARTTQFTSSSDYYQPDGSAFDLSSGDGEYYNLDAKDGWWVDKITTDQSLKGSVVEFVDKEGKWYNRIDGGARGTITDADLNEFSVQGLGVATSVNNDTVDNINNDTVSDISLYVTSDFIDDPTNTTD